jgi:glutamine synthetase
MFSSYEEVTAFCKEKQIQMIDFKMIDLLGRWRHLGIPIGRFTPGILEHGIGFDGSNYGFAPVEKSDMIFIPDLSTAVFDPFTQVPTLSMIGDVFVISEPENYRFDQDPRAIAIKAEEYMASTGIADEIRIGPEYEFNVFDHVSYTCQPQKSSFSIDAHQAMMIEPTETESKERMDDFIAAMKSIAKEAKETPELLLGAPHNAVIRRVDEVKAARKPVVKWEAP